jgi:hypothetical protein
VKITSFWRPLGDEDTGSKHLWNVGLLLSVSKAVPLHAMGALGGTGGIASTHSRPRHWMGVSGQRHAPTALYPRGKDPPGTHCTGGWVGPRAGLDILLSDYMAPIFQKGVIFIPPWEPEISQSCRLCITKHHVMQTCGGEETQPHTFLTSALYRNDLLPSRPGRLTPEERTPVPTG